MTTMFNSNITNMTVIPEYTKDTSIFVRTLIFLLISIGISILNISCLVVLAKEKKLKEKRFNTLTIFLSISDAATGLFSAAMSFHSIYNSLTGNGFAPFCVITISLTVTTILFSLLQTLWICVERLIATFPTVRNPCLNVSVVFATIVIFILCGCVSFPANIAYGNIWSESCSAPSVYGKNRIAILNIYQPIYLIIVVCIVATYIGVICRLYKSWKRIHPTVGAQLALRRYMNTDTSTMSMSPTQATGIVNDNTNSEYGTTSAQHQRTHSGIKRIRRMTITLGLLIMVMLLSVLPNIIVGLVVISHPFNVKAHTALSVSNIFLFINPLFDPIIYVLRMRSFRQHLKCR